MRSIGQIVRWLALAGVGIVACATGDPTAGGKGAGGGGGKLDGEAVGTGGDGTPSGGNAGLGGAGPPDSGRMGGSSGSGSGGSGGQGMPDASMGTGGLGMPDASMARPDAGGSSGAGGSAAACAAPGLIVCDHFESGFTRWVKHPMAGSSVTLDNTRGHKSTTSVKVTSGNGPFAHFSTPAGSIPSTRDFYVRAWAYFAKSTAQIPGHVAYIVGATSEDNSGVEVRFGSSKTFSSSPMSMLDLNLIGSGSEFTQFSNGDITGGAGTIKPGVALEADRWYCLEAFFKGSTSEFHAWVDEQEIPGLHVTDFGGRRANWAPNYTLVKVGGQDFSGAIGTVWYDDVAMGSQRIRCNQ